MNVPKGLAYIATWALLLWTDTIPWMQFMQFTYGVACSTEVAYYTYIYAKVGFYFFVTILISFGHILTQIHTQYIQSTDFQTHPKYAKIQRLENKCKLKMLCKMFLPSF